MHRYIRSLTLLRNVHLANLADNVYTTRNLRLLAADANLWTSQTRCLARDSKKHIVTKLKASTRVSKASATMPVPKSIEDIIKPVEVKPNPQSDEDIGVELCGALDKKDINEALINFKKDEKIVLLAKESGINARMFADALISFRKFCLKSKTLPAELHIKLHDIIRKAANVSDLFPFYLKHAQEIYPHLSCMEELKQISDLTEPTYWYVEARDIKRKVIYHAGPTNSGKTYSALKRFQTSPSGLYCGPLKLLASEVFIKTNNTETPCDLMTGEERKMADPDGITPAAHVACTVEMASLEKDFEVAVIDEIQMIRDAQRGWAWTRAFLGLRAKEIHVCGDQSAIDLISDLAFLAGDEFEVRKYERLTPLTIENKALGSYDNVEPGDCIVCFNKSDIYRVVSNLEKRGHQVAVIYGAMPPGVKLAQAARFNDPKDNCKILVATDAVGMGLNLNIRRVIFYDIKKVQLIDPVQEQGVERENEVNSIGGLKEVEYIKTWQALQIAGRAGRFNTQFSHGFVTTFKPNDLPILKQILNQPLERITKAGLHPTADQIELFAYQLPNQPLSKLIDIFVNMCKVDSSQYFLCNFKEIKGLAELIDHIPVNLKAKYTFACSPITLREPYLTSCFVKFVRAYSNNELVNADMVKKMISYPFEMPRSVADLQHLEVVYDVLDLYLWLSNRFSAVFNESHEIRALRVDLEAMIYKGIKELSKSSSWNEASRLASNHHRHGLIRSTKSQFNPSPESAVQIKNMFSSAINRLNTTSNQPSSSVPKLPEPAATPYHKEKEEILRLDEFDLSKLRPKFKKQNNEQSKQKAKASPSTKQIVFEKVGSPVMLKKVREPPKSESQQAAEASKEQENVSIDAKSRYERLYGHFSLATNNNKSVVNEEEKDQREINLIDSK